MCKYRWKIIKATSLNNCLITIIHFRFYAFLLSGQTGWFFGRLVSAPLDVNLLSHYVPTCWDIASTSDWQSVCDIDLEFVFIASFTLKEFATTTRFSHEPSPRGRNDNFSTNLSKLQIKNTFLWNTMHLLDLFGSTHTYSMYRLNSLVKFEWIKSRG